MTPSSPAARPRAGHPRRSAGPAPAGEPGRGRGRPRSAERHAAILRATRELILEVGYGRLTIDAVARRSGASRTTIYERWGHRASLVEEAIFSDYGEWPVPDTGAFESDLAQLVREIVREMSRPVVARAYPALAAEFQADPALKQQLRARYGDPMTLRWRRVFERAIDRGELPKGADPEAALQLTLGAVLTLTQSKVLPRRELMPYLTAVLTGGLPATGA